MSLFSFFLFVPSVILFLLSLARVETNCAVKRRMMIFCTIKHMGTNLGGEKSNNLIAMFYKCQALYSLSKKDVCYSATHGAAIHEKTLNMPQKGLTACLTAD